MNRREMMEEMIAEIAAELRGSRGGLLRERMIYAATRTLNTRASRARAEIVLEAVIRYLEGDGGRAGGF